MNTATIELNQHELEATLTALQLSVDMLRTLHGPEDALLSSVMQDIIVKLKVARFESRKTLVA